MIPSSNYTGVDGNMTIVIDTGPGKISKGSYINVTIPGDFRIFNSSYAANTCNATYGFIDDITCTFIENTTDTGYTLNITGGFDSDDFSGGNVSFTINEIRNPLTTKTT